ncbi:MAG TPA: hypothetical protein VIA18_19395, partial [Polyangia bacterium]|nr:hypothetical protein [Polyangia bacterium]
MWRAPEEPVERFLDRGHAHAAIGMPSGSSTMNGYGKRLAPLRDGVGRAYRRCAAESPGVSHFVAVRRGYTGAVWFDLWPL